MRLLVLVLNKLTGAEMTITNLILSRLSRGAESHEYRCDHN